MADPRQSLPVVTHHPLLPAAEPVLNLLHSPAFDVPAAHHWASLEPCPASLHLHLELKPPTVIPRPLNDTCLSFSHPTFAPSEGFLQPCGPWQITTEGRKRWPHSSPWDWLSSLADSDP